MQIYNTMTRQKEEFVPIEPGKVRLICLRANGVQLHPHRLHGRCVSLMCCAAIWNGAATR